MPSSYYSSDKRNPFLRTRKKRLSHLSTLRDVEARQTSWMDRPTPGRFLAQNLKDVGELLTHIQMLQEEGSLANSPNLFKNYLARASKELVDLCKLITERMRGAQDMEILEATASLINELALSETDDSKLEALASTMEEIQPTGTAIAAALSTANEMTVTDDRSSLDFDRGKLVVHADFDISVAFVGKSPMDFTVKADQKIDFDDIKLKSDT